MVVVPKPAVKFRHHELQPKIKQAIRENEKCPVCLEVHTVAQARIAPCGRVFCDECIVKSIAEIDRCPVCRFEPLELVKQLKRVTGPAADIPVSSSAGGHIIDATGESKPPAKASANARYSSSLPTPVPINGKDLVEMGYDQGVLECVILFRHKNKFKTFAKTFQPPKPNNFDTIEASCFGWRITLPQPR